MLKPPLRAQYASYAPTFVEQQRTAAQKEGLRYEAAVLRKLKLACPKMKPGPWLYYRAANKSGVCQPDALLWLGPNLLCIVEVKLTHKYQAREKLLHFYGPVVQAIHPDVQICYMQIYKRASNRSHKRTLSIYDLDKHKAGVYRECQLLS